jgi:hypothetical protein
MIINISGKCTTTSRGSISGGLYITDDEMHLLSWKIADIQSCTLTPRYCEKLVHAIEPFKMVQEIDRVTESDVAFWMETLGKPFCVEMGLDGGAPYIKGGPSLPSCDWRKLYFSQALRAKSTANNEFLGLDPEETAVCINGVGMMTAVLLPKIVARHEIETQKAIYNIFSDHR